MSWPTLLLGRITDLKIFGHPAFFGKRKFFYLYSHIKSCISADVAEDRLYGRCKRNPEPKDTGLYMYSNKLKDYLCYGAVPINTHI